MKGNNTEEESGGAWSLFLDFKQSVALWQSDTMEHVTEKCIGGPNFKDFPCWQIAPASPQACHIVMYIIIMKNQMS